MANPAEYGRALSALKAELAYIAKWYGAPHIAYAREMQAKGQLDLDYQSLDKKLRDLRTELPSAKRAKFDGCAQEIALAFGEMIIHAGFPYDDQLNVMRGWPEAWRKLDNALKGISLFLEALSSGKREPGQSSSSGGAGGHRIDLFGIDRGCA
jgi:hypothetical protein